MNLVRTQKFVLLALALLAGSFVWRAQRTSAPRPSSARGPVPFTAATFRITLGLTDAAPALWSGEAVAPGQDISVEADHFRVHKYAGFGSDSGPDPDLPNDYVRGR